jgi:hypothetical protein
MQLDSWTALVTLTAASSAFAGMLMVEVYGLREIAASGEASALATVVTKADVKTNREMTVKVERVFGASKRFQAGANVKVQLAKLDVEWTDPGESPIDEQLRGSLGNADVGTRVIVVPSRKGDVELLAATEANVMKAAVLYDSDGERGRFLGSATTTLEGALADEDLAPLAAAELKKRGALHAAHVLQGAERFAYDHYRSLKHDERRRFLEDALVAARVDAAAAERLFRMAVMEPCPSTIAPLAQIIPLVDKTRWSDARIALLQVAKGDDARCPKSAPADLSPFVEFLADYWRQRPEYQRSGDEQFALLTDRMERAAQARLAVLLLSNALSDKGLDAFLVGSASALAVKAPSAEIVAPMAKLSPIKGDRKMADPSAMLAMGSAVVEKFPAERARVQAILQPYLDMKAPAEASVLTRYRAIVGALGPSAPVATSFELRPGEMRRLADGAQVSLRNENGELVLWFAHLKHSRNLLREIDVDGYHEWWVEPYVLTADGPKDRVTITVTPHAEMPAHLNEADATALGRAKCGEQIERDYKPWLGRMIYQGDNGRCVVGAFTKTVLLRSRSPK